MIKGVKFEPGTVYLTGSISGPESERIDEIKQWISQLEEKGFKVITPFELFENTDTDDFSDQDVMRSRIRALLLCEKVYTMPDWDTCEKTKQEIEVARALQIEVNTVLNLVREQA